MGVKRWRDNPAPHHDRHTIEKTGKTALFNACFTLQINAVHPPSFGISWEFLDINGIGLGKSATIIGWNGENAAFRRCKSLAGGSMDCERSRAA
jgi:hypothetical protein